MWYNEPITLRKKSALDDLRARYGNRLWVASLDVTDSEAVRQVVNRAFFEMGQIDIVDALKMIPEIGGAFLAGGPQAALTKAITATAAQFFVEVAAKSDKEEALKRSGLTYLLRLKAFHDERK